MAETTIKKATGFIMGGNNAPDTSLSEDNKREVSKFSTEDLVAISPDTNQIIPDVKQPTQTRKILL